MENQLSILHILMWPLRILIVLLQILLFSALILAGWLVLQMFGVFSVQVPVSGESMLPTLPKTGYVSFQRYISDSRIQAIISQNFSHGDMVVFENNKTHEELLKQKKAESGFVKRIVGLPGDVVSIKNGFVNLNGEIIKEQYTLQPRSTFGGSAIRDCQEIKIPEGKLFVLGDNRKLSMDSREIGLIDMSDIQYYIPYDKQQTRFSALWRDVSGDMNAQFDSLFNSNEYLRLLNAERKNKGLDELKYQVKLEKSANLRAVTMLKYDDFSFEAQKSGYTMEKAMTEVGYSNILYGEFPMTGYYTAQELFDAFMENPASMKFLLNKDYDEIGASTFVGQINNCPLQVVVQHMAGYVPPDYKSSDIESWKNGAKSLREIMTGWEDLKKYPTIYDKNKSDIDRINEIIKIRIERIDKIVKRMEAQEWLTDEEKKFMEEDSRLGEEQTQISGKINNAN